MSTQVWQHRQDIEPQREGSVVHFVRCPNLSESGIKVFGKKILKQADNQDPNELYLDFSAVEYMTGRALGVLVALRQKLAASGGRLVLCNVSDFIGEIFEVSNLQSLFEIRPPCQRSGSLRRRYGVHEERQGRKSGNCRVLVVEDNAAMAPNLKHLLDGNEHQIDVASGGEEALRNLPGSNTDVVLLDLGLPNMDGYEVAERIRDIGGASMRILAVTGYGEPDSLQRAQAAGVDHFLVKPVDAARLVALVQGRWGEVA